MTTEWFTLCCCCRTIFDPDTVNLPQGHMYCPHCTGKACTITEGESLEDALRRRIAKHGKRKHDYKVWKPTDTKP